MKSIVLALLMSLAPLAAPATEAPDDSPVARWQADPTVVLDAAEVELSAFHWIARAVVVFADSPNDPRFAEQMTLLAALPDDLAERDVVIIADSDPDAMSNARQKLRPRGFMLAVLAKDGTVAFRKPFPWDVREISRAIDKMPLREQEIRDRHPLNTTR